MKIGIVGKSRYIDADKLWNDRPQLIGGESLGFKAGFSECMWGFSKRIKEQISHPTADVEEVRHGTWYHGTEHGAVYAKCSACGRKMNYSCYGYAYCALCGAKMDKERRDEE